jgi:hypothetical protein
LDDPVARVQDRPSIETRERLGKRVDPFAREPVVAERLQLARERLGLELVGGQAKAADALQGVPGKGLDAVDRALAERPELPCTLHAELEPGRVVRGGAAAKHEAAASAARALSDPARLV